MCVVPRREGLVAQRAGGCTIEHVQPSVATTSVWFGTLLIGLGVADVFDADLLGVFPVMRLVIVLAFVASLVARVWRLDVGPALVLALSGVAAGLLLLGMVSVDSTAVIALYLAAGALTFGFMAQPWLALRRVIKAKAGRGDGTGLLLFLDGTSGRALDAQLSGDLIAWPAREVNDASGYREDANALRYRVVPGTRQEYVARTRRRASVGVVVATALLALVSLFA